MSLEIKKSWMNVNEYDCQTHYIIVPFKKTLTYKDKWHYNRVPKTEETKYKHILIKNIPKDEKILDYDVRPGGYKEIIFEMYTKKYTTIAKEKEIKQKLEQAGYKQSDYMPITINENGWAQIAEIPLTEEDITKVKKITQAKKWYIKQTRDDGAFLMLKIENKEK